MTKVVEILNFGNESFSSCAFIENFKFRSKISRKFQQFLMKNFEKLDVFINFDFFI